MAATRILNINPGSDGDGRKWPKHTYTRNDDHYRKAVATNFWIKDLPGGPDPNVTYMLNKLPNGYGGFEKLRPDGERIDYFLYGHPNGRFDSVVKFYPHFKHLMDHGDSQGCACDLCTAGPAKKKVTAGIAAASRNESERSASPPRRSRYFDDQPQSSAAAPNLISPFHAKPRGRPPKNGTMLTSGSQKRIDFEGTPDVYEAMVAKLKEAEAGQVIDLPIEERQSPDWRAGNTLSRDLFKKLQKLPHYVPRTGEIVLFVRRIPAEEDQISNESLHQLNWEAGVVTQMPKEPVSEEDLISDSGKEQGVNYSGFRVEPLSQPGTDSKPYSSQYKYVPLHLIRPFVYWQECLKGLSEKDWHPTIWHALTVMNSFCVVGRYKFKGIWPNASVFCQGVYVGSELITVGDLVRLLPRPREQSADLATDVMEVTAIKLRFVNLDLEEDDMWSDSGIPYQTSLHISGRVYTLDPSRSFDGVGKSPIDSNSILALSNLSKYGPWYHYSDPSKTTARIEVPYTRILSRSFDVRVFHEHSTPKLNDAKQRQVEMSPGLKGLLDSRKYSKTHDKRIKSDEGQSWFWADSRIEQLDLHEVNGRYVGAKRERTQTELRQWRAAMKALDGKKGALQELQAVKKDVEKVDRKSSQFSSSAYGMVAASRELGTESPATTDAENLLGEEGDEESQEENDDDAEDGRNDKYSNEHDDDEASEDFHDAMEVDGHWDASVRSANEQAAGGPETQQASRSKPQ